MNTRDHSILHLNTN